MKPGAKWFLAEGGDSCLLSRSIPLVQKANDDALVVWAQNGEPLRPEQGFPIRLLLPGFEGNSNVKWLRRIKLGTEPFMTRWETSKYTDPLPGGKVAAVQLRDGRQVDHHESRVSRAHCRRRGGGRFADSRGAGAVGSRASTSAPTAAATWQEAALRSPATPKAQVRFELPWRWTGERVFS